MCIALVSGFKGGFSLLFTVDAGDSTFEVFAVFWHTRGHRGGADDWTLEVFALLGTEEVIEVGKIPEEEVVCWVTHHTNIFSFLLTLRLFSTQTLKGIQIYSGSIESENIMTRVPQYL